MRFAGSDAVTLHATLQLIVDKLSESLPDAMADLSVFDEASGRMLVVAQHGLPLSAEDTAGFPSAHSVAYHTITTEQPVAYRDVLAQSDFPGARESAKRWGFRAILCVPLALESPRYALFILLPYEHEFTPAEIAYAMVVAKQAAVAIRNAQLYEQQLSVVQQLTDLNSLLEREKRELESAVALHDELTGLLLRGGGVEVLSSTIAHFLARPVLVEDSFFEPLVHAREDGSFTISRDAVEVVSVRELPPSALGALRETRRALHVPGGSGRTGRLVAPIFAASQHLGYLSVLGVRAAPVWFELITVERCTAMLAVALLNQKALADAELRLKSNYLDELLANPDKQTLLQRVGALGFDFRRAFSVLLLQHDSDLGDPASTNEGPAIAELRKAAERAATSVSERHLVLPRDGSLIVLLAPRSNEPDKYPMDLAEAFRRALASRWSRSTVSIAVGPNCPDWRALSGAVAEVGRTLRALRRLGARAEVANLEQLGLFGIMLDSTGGADIDRFCERLIGPLQSHDRTRAGELEKTLGVYLDANGNARRAARLLNVHINTIRHRLANIEALTAMSLDDPEARLNLHVALRLVGARGRSHDLP